MNTWKECFIQIFCLLQTKIWCQQYDRRWNSKWVFENIKILFKYFDHFEAKISS
jgi:hypothetical protein